MIVQSQGVCLPSETPPLTAKISDPTGARVLRVSARSQRALDDATKDVLLYRLDRLSGVVDDPAH